MSSVCLVLGLVLVVDTYSTVKLLVTPFCYEHPKSITATKSGSNQFTQFPYVLITYASTPPLCPQIPPFTGIPSRNTTAFLILGVLHTQTITVIWPLSYNFPAVTSWSTLYQVATMLDAFGRYSIRRTGPKGQNSFCVYCLYYKANHADRKIKTVN